MNSTIRKITSRELLRSPGRFVAIFLIIILGAGFLTGLQSASPGMSSTADKYFLDKQLADIWLFCDKGIGEKDVEAIKELPEVAEANVGYRVDLLASANDKTFVASVRSIAKDATLDSPTYLSQFNLLEGRLPISETECIADPISNMEIGDTVFISDNNWESSLELVSQRCFTVVGLAWSPIYISTDRGSTNISNGSVNQFLFVPEDAFSSDWYTELAVRLKTTEGLSAFSAEYAQAIEDAKAKLDSLTFKRAELRFEEIQDEVSDKLNESEDTLKDKEAEAKDELEAAKKELENGRAGLSKAKAEYSKQLKILASSRTKLEKGKRTLEAKYKELKTERKTLDKGREALEDGEDSLEEAEDLRNSLEIVLSYEADPTAQATLQAQISALDSQIAVLKSEVAAGRAEIKAGEKLLAPAESAYASAKADIKKAEKKLADGTSALEDFKKQIASTEAKLNSGATEYDEQSELAEDEFADVRAELDEGWKDWQALEWPEWTIQDRDDLPGYSTFSADTARVSSLALILPWFFFIVAAIVCLTTMTRLMDEHRSQIGTLKANGYRGSQISASYQLYAWTIGLTGGAIGVVFGLQVFPAVVWNSYSFQYQMGDYETVVSIVPCIVGLIGGAIALSVATAIACRKTLNRNAAELMRPRAPRLGRRTFLEYVPILWRRLSFSHKATVRNLLRYKVRFFVTVIGVAGCTALLVAGLGVPDSISSIVDKQYGEVSSAQATLLLEDPSSASEKTELNSILADGDIVSSYVCNEDILVTYGDRASTNIPTHLFVPEDPKSFTKLINFRERADHTPIEFPLDESKGPTVIITEQIATILGIQIGDSISFGPRNAQPTKAIVGAISENYVYNYVYLTSSSYERLIGKPPGYNTVVMRSKLQDEKFEALLTELVATDNVATALPVSQLKVIMDKVIVNLSAVIWLMVLAALMLAAIVIYNLITINVNERERELATLKVLGYRRREVAAYITREAFAMVFIGIVVGLVCGTLLHGYVMAVLVDNEIMFPTIITELSYVLAGVTPLLCAVFVNFCIRPRLNRIDPAISLKSKE